MLAHMYSVLSWSSSFYQTICMRFYRQESTKTTKKQESATSAKTRQYEQNHKNTQFRVFFKTRHYEQNHKNAQFRFFGAHACADG